MQESGFPTLSVVSRLQINQALLDHRLLIVSTSVFQWRHSCNFSKYFTKRFHIRITNFIHYLINCFATRFKRLFCRFNFYSLRIFNRSISGCFDKPSVKVSSADREPGRQVFNRYFFMQVTFNICLCFSSPCNF